MSGGVSYSCWLIRGMSGGVRCRSRGVGSWSRLVGSWSRRRKVGIFGLGSIVRLWTVGRFGSICGLIFWFGIIIWLGSIFRFGIIRGLGSICWLGIIGWLRRRIGRLGSRWMGSGLSKDDSVIVHLVGLPVGFGRPVVLGLGGVGGLPLVGHLSVETVVVSCISDELDPAVGQCHLVLPFRYPVIAP